MSRHAKVQLAASLLILASMAGFLTLEMMTEASWKAKVPLVIVFVIVAAIGLGFALLAWCDRPKRSRPQARTTSTADSPPARSTG